MGGGYFILAPNQIPVTMYVNKTLNVPAVSSLDDNNYFSKSSVIKYLE